MTEVTRVPSAQDSRAAQATSPAAPGSSWGRTARQLREHWELALAAVLALGICLLTAFPGMFEFASPGAVSLLDRLQAPSGAHLLGTDELGRDELSRIIAGFRWSLGTAAIAVVISTIVGTALGVIGACWGGFPRWLVRRGLDIAIAFPFLVVAVVVIVVVGHSFLAVAVTLGIVLWPLFTRVTLAEGMVIAQQEYYLAARLMGVRPIRLVARHVIPGVRRTVLVLVSFAFADLILLQAALSLIGLGSPLGTATWGNMLAASEEYLVNAPWLMAAPAGTIVLVVVTANLLADGLSSYDSRQR